MLMGLNLKLSYLPAELASPNFNPKQHKKNEDNIMLGLTWPHNALFPNPALPFSTQWSSQVIHQTTTLSFKAMNQQVCRNVAYHIQGEKPRLSVYGWITFTSQRLHNRLFKSFVLTTFLIPLEENEAPLSDV